MTNKLPEIGKKYKHKIINIVLKISKIENEKIYVENYTTDFEEFLKEFQELPDDKPEIRKENPPVISELSEEVKQAMENLKLSNELLKEKVKSMEAHLKEANDEDAIEISQPFIDTIKIKIQQSQDLVDALNKQFGGEND